MTASLHGQQGQYSHRIASYMRVQKLMSTREASGGESGYVMDAILLQHCKMR
jgi:hypothetical protein